jgi:ParB/RepB/Spo0J family partition protein
MKIETVKITDLTPYGNNPRKNDSAVDTVANSIEQFGFQQPIVVDKNNVIIVGHTRYRAAKKLNLKEVPVIVADTLTDDQAKQYRLMDNRSNENSHWDDDLLFQELQSLLKDDDLAQLSFETGFTEAQLNKMFTDDTQEKIDEYLKEKTYKSRVGDLWTLGDHKLLNGSSTEPDDVKLLLDKERIDMIWEDPPYGITYKSVNDWRSGSDPLRMQKAEDRMIKNDNLTEHQLGVFLATHLAVVDHYVRGGAPIYWCHDIRLTQQFKGVLEQYKYHISDILIWKKNQTSNFLAEYWKFYEPIFYGWKQGAEHPWYGKGMTPNAFTLEDLNNRTKEELITLIQSMDTNYQEVDREKKAIASLHPTVKPSRLIANHIINSSKPGDIIYDGFSGSGSTLIAAEKTGRKARCIELETKFCDVTIARWQDITGLEAVRQDGVKWNDVNRPEVDTSQMEAFFDLPLADNKEVV